MHCNFFGFICSVYKPKVLNFELADKDKDGLISLDEFHSYYVKNYGKPPTNEQWIKFHLSDRNNNGFISKSDIDNFQKFNSVL